MDQRQAAGCLSDQLDNIVKSIDKQVEEMDEHYHFAMQLLPILRSLPSAKGFLLKSKIMAMLAEAVNDKPVTREISPSAACSNFTMLETSQADPHGLHTTGSLLSELYAD